MEKGTGLTNSVTVERELDLIEFGLYLLSRAKLIIAVTLVVMLGTGIYVSYFVTPMYEATAQVYVLSSRDSAVNLSDLQIGAYLTEDYQYVFRTWEVNQQVIMNLNLPYTVKELRNMIYITNPSDTRALFINAESPDPNEAAMIANEFASVASDYIKDTMLAERPTLFSMALAPLEPAKPQKLTNVALGFAAGLFLAVVVLSLIFILDDRIQTPGDLEKFTGSAPIAVIPVIKDYDSDNDWI